MPICRHTDSIEGQPGLLGEAPGANGCQDCLPDHDDWIHLRRCLHCGRVLCCEESPRQHAKAHAIASHHPLVQSFEPGEDWVWCYADNVYVLLPEAANSPSHDGTHRP
jgi:hypothetical protein